MGTLRELSDAEQLLGSMHHLRIGIFTGRQ
jgi:hypothetical protein